MVDSMYGEHDSRSRWKSWVVTSHSWAAHSLSTLPLSLSGPGVLHGFTDAKDGNYFPLFSCSVKEVKSGHLIRAGVLSLCIMVFSLWHASLAFPVMNLCSTLFLKWILASFAFCLNPFFNSPTLLVVFLVCLFGAGQAVYGGFVSWKRGWRKQSCML